jgi:hypothetical protein
MLLSVSPIRNWIFSLFDIFAWLGSVRVLYSLFFGLGCSKLETPTYDQHFLAAWILILRTVRREHVTSWIWFFVCPGIASQLLRFGTRALYLGAHVVAEASASWSTEPDPAGSAVDDRKGLEGCGGKPVRKNAEGQPRVQWPSR